MNIDKDILKEFIMKQIVIIMMAVTLTLTSQLVAAAPITDTYTAGDPLTTTTLDNIKAAVNDNDTNITSNTADIASNAAAIAAKFSTNRFMEFFTTGVDATAAVRSDWNTFRASLQPDEYTCVQLIGNLGLGGAVCDAANVPLIATALRDSVSASITVSNGDIWNVGPCAGGTEIGVNSTAVCQCTTGSVLRPDVGAGDWGGIGGLTCSSGPNANQTIQLIFR